MLRNNPCIRLVNWFFSIPQPLPEDEDEKKSAHLSLAVNLDEYPEKIVNNSKNHFTIGDLHGNALKMLYFLIKIGLLDINRDDYLQLCDAYHKIEKGQDNAIFDFEKIIHRYYLSNKNNIINFKVRFLGDLLADRGANDYLTFLVLSLLRNENYEIIFSNHDLEYLTHSECNKLDKQKANYIHPMFTNSLTQLKKFLNSQKQITADYIHSLEALYYKPHLKLISYSLPKNQQSIHIYTHALIDLSTIMNIASTLGIQTEHLRDSRNELCKVIDAINVYFQLAVKKGVTYQSFDLIASDAGSGHVSYAYPFVQTVWNRKLKHDIVETNNKASYTIEFYHGHTEKLDFAHYHGYDNVLGKGVQHETGNLDIYRSDNPSCRPY